MIYYSIICSFFFFVNSFLQKDATLESIRNENDQLNDELQRLRNEIQRLQSAYDTTVNEVSALKLQLDDRSLVAVNTPPVDVVRKIFI